MIKIGVLGLGGIAQKAYLPVMAEMQDQIDWVLCTRNPDKLVNLQRQYGFKTAVRTVPELLAQKIEAVFIHTPTSTHATLIKTFLEAGVHVYVDKPVSDNYSEVKALYQLAAERHLLLTAGFNRRFAPFETQLVTQQQPAVIKVEKNRANTEQPVEFAIFDLMIHAVDTALFVGNIQTNEPFTQQYQLNSEQGILQYCAITIRTQHQLVTASVNMQAGANLEVTEVQQPTGTQRLSNLTELATLTTSKTQVQRFPDWTPTLEQRGFAPLIRAFVAAVKDPAHPNPVSPASSLLSHQLCQDLVTEYQTSI